MKPYKLPKNYLDFQEFQKHLSKISKEPPKPLEAYFSITFMLRYLSYLYSFWAKGYPVYCVRESLLADMQATDVGDKIPLFDSIDLEMPSYLLFLPRRKVKSCHDGNYIDYLVINYQAIDLPEYKYLISWGCLDSGKQWILGSKRIRRDGTLQSSNFATDNPEQQKQVLEIRNLVLQSILLLQHYPELAQEMKSVPGKEKGFGQQNICEFRLPRWLGEERKARTKSAGTSTGTGSSKSPHYRRWHWRVQPYGEGRSKTKIIRIETMKINMGED